VLIEYKITVGPSGVTITQRIEPDNGTPTPEPGTLSPQTTAVWKSLGRSFFEAPSGGGGTDPMGPPGGGGTDPMAPPGGGGTDPMAPPGGGGTDPMSPPGGGGTESTAPPGGGGTESTAPPGGGGTESTSPPGGGRGQKPVIIFGPIVMLG
jgi:hypothetical protein